MNNKIATTFLVGSLAILVSGCEAKKPEPSPFDCFYNDLVIYSQAYNTSKTNPTPESIRKEAGLRERILKERKMFPGMEKCTMEVCSNEDVESTIEAYERKGKVYGYVPSLYAPNKNSIILGNIVKMKDEVFNDNGENLHYKIIIFEEEAQSIENAMGKQDRMCYWYHDRAYLNLTKAKEWSKIMFETAREWENEKVEPSTFYGKTLFETYKALMGEIRKQHPFLSGIKSYGFFEEAFIEMIVETSLKHHEPMHKKYPHTEIEAYLNQIANTPDLNACVFWMMGTDSKEMDFFKEAGYTEESIFNMKPGERSQAASRLSKQNLR
ncbi:hypothetical protein COV19_07705 [Candidatus Woesearchaeota archaeon CG10_big_fil_rev_8_21_14_0_10_44_13]|nr:MAG: hypothetical protein COV19_07705 [Candidatus Woesearchaeota archaeon CG10_big_fil_rev_8_21_14_0_10_44_13]